LYFKKMTLGLRRGYRRKHCDQRLLLTRSQLGSQTPNGVLLVATEIPDDLHTLLLNEDVLQMQDLRLAHRTVC